MQQRSRWAAAVLGWAVWALTLLGLAATLWIDALLREAGREELATSRPAASRWRWRW